jgi:hypothetical protein
MVRARELSARSQSPASRAPHTFITQVEGLLDLRQLPLPGLESAEGRPALSAHATRTWRMLGPQARASTIGRHRSLPTLNQRVQGSSPCAPAVEFKGLAVIALAAASQNIGLGSTWEADWPPNTQLRQKDERSVPKRGLGAHKARTREVHCGRKSGSPLSMFSPQVSGRRFSRRSTGACSPRSAITLASRHRATAIVLSATLGGSASSHA